MWRIVVIVMDLDMGGRRIISFRRNSDLGNSFAGKAIESIRHVAKNVLVCDVKVGDFAAPHST